MKRIVTIGWCLLFYFFSFSLNDAIHFLINTEDNNDIESSSDEEDHDLALLPPIERENTETDMDSDASDDMNEFSKVLTKFNMRPKSSWRKK